MNNRMRWIPIDCTIPTIAGILIGFACAIGADILSLWHVNWFFSVMMWLAPIAGAGYTYTLYQDGLKELNDV